MEMDTATKRAQDSYLITALLGKNAVKRQHKTGELHLQLKGGKAVTPQHLHYI